jgi:isocitrate dehydrogenase
MSADGAAAGTLPDPPAEHPRSRRPMNAAAMTPPSIPVTLIPGDGVGPEIVRSAVRLIDATGVRIAWEEAAAGADVFRRGDTSGVPRETRDSIERTRVALKGPLETPVGFGEKSANVTLRKLFETYANVRPARELPGVQTRYAGEGIDFIVVRENLEDLYAGIEYMQTPDVAQSLKIITRRGTEKIVRYAFELAVREGRGKVTCATKANIMKLSDGLFKRVFEEMAPEYPGIAAEHLIIDNVAHQMVKNPAQFDVIVTANLYGDIISDLASGLVGGLGFASSANYGDDVAIFEAVHGSAPKYAGRDVINPTALILSSVLMLRHLGLGEAADRIEDAVLVTLEEGRAITRDLLSQAGGDVSTAASTTKYTDAIIANLGRGPACVPSRSARIQPPTAGAGAAAGGTRGRSASVRSREARPPVERRLVGVDIFIETDMTAQDLGHDVELLGGDSFVLEFVDSRGTQLYPPTGLRVESLGWFRCRYLANGPFATDDEVRALVGNVAMRHRWTHVEKLHLYDGEPGFTKTQGQ